MKHIFIPESSGPRLFYLVRLLSLIIRQWNAKGLQISIHVVLYVQWTSYFLLKIRVIVLENTMFTILPLPFPHYLF